MESRHGMSIKKQSSRSQVLSFAAILMAVTGRVDAGPVTLPTSGGGTVRAWNVPYNPTSVGMVSSLQGLLRTEAGAGLLAQAPALNIINRMDSGYESHRRILGALALPAVFENQIQTALQTADNKALANALGTILHAYHSRNVEATIQEAVQARAEQIAAAVSQGGMDTTRLSTVAEELAAFESISERAMTVGEMARTARATRTMDTAQRIAATLRNGKNPLAAYDGPGVRGENQPSVGTTYTHLRPYAAGSGAARETPPAVPSGPSTQWTAAKGVQRLLTRVSAEAQNFKHVGISFYVSHFLERSRWMRGLQRPEPVTRYLFATGLWNAYRYADSKTLIQALQDPRLEEGRIIQAINIIRSLPLDQGAAQLKALYDYFHPSKAMGLGEDFTRELLLEHDPQLHLSVDLVRWAEGLILDSIRAVGQTKNKDAIGALLMIATGESNHSFVARIEAIRALGQIAPSDTAIEEKMIEIATDGTASSLLRARAVRVLKSSGSDKAMAGVRRAVALDARVDN